MAKKLGLKDNSIIRYLITNSKAMLGLYIVFATILISCTIAVSVDSDNKSILTEDMYPLTMCGTYSTDGGHSFTAFKSFDDIDCRKLDSLIIRGNFNQDIKKNHKVYLFIDNINVKISQNNQVIYENDPEVPFCWDCFSSLGIGMNDEIEIELNTRESIVYNRSFKLLLNRMSDTTKSAVLCTMVLKNLPGLICCVIILLMSIAMIMYAFENHKYNTVSVHGIMAGGFSLLMGAGTCVARADYVTLIMPDIRMLCFLDVLTQDLVILFTMIYLQRYLSSDRSKIICRLTALVGGALISVFVIGYACDLFGIATHKCVMFPGVFLISINVYMLVHDCVDNQSKVFKTVLYASVFLLLCTIFEMLFYLLTGTYCVKVLTVGMLLFAVSQYMTIILENVNRRKEAMRAKELEQELTESRISIMRSQIKPHFLYNALGTIRALCTKDPEEARNAMDFFAKYLRANMESLDRKETIPFTKELEHVKSYLYIEKLRFGDLLNIEYDIQATDFELPCMTVQTLTENAVKHGLLAKAEGGTLKISSVEKNSCYEVQIEDDGVGFDSTTKLDDSRTHVGIENSRKRLAGLCDGTLSIGSKIGVGTTITITIPKKRENVNGD